MRFKISNSIRIVFVLLFLLSKHTRSLALGVRLFYMTDGQTLFMTDACTTALDVFASEFSHALRISLESVIESHAPNL